MRGSLGRRLISNSFLSRGAMAFSTFPPGGGGDGRGKDRGSKPNNDNDNDSGEIDSGVGHGRGDQQPLPSSNPEHGVLPSSISSSGLSSAGAGREESMKLSPEEDAVKKSIEILSRAGGGGGAMEESEKGGRRVWLTELGIRFKEKINGVDKLIEAMKKLSIRRNVIYRDNPKEYDPKYLLEEFVTSAPTSLRDDLKEVKDFLIASERVKDRKEWRMKVMIRTRYKFPVLRELIYIYSYPDSETAKQQIQELATFAKTLPGNPIEELEVTDRLDHFMDHVSLERDPGWVCYQEWLRRSFNFRVGTEVSQQYKLAPQGPSGQKDLASVFLFPNHIFSKY